MIQTEWIRHYETTVDSGLLAWEGEVRCRASIGPHTFAASARVGGTRTVPTVEECLAAERRARATVEAQISAARRAEL